jgi:hypothetical protein
LDFCFAYLDILFFSRSPPRALPMPTYTLHLTPNLRYPAQPSQVRFLCPRNFVSGIKNRIPGFPASPGASRRFPSLSSHDRQPIPTFLVNAKFLPAFPSQRCFHSSPSSRRPFHAQIKRSHPVTWTEARITAIDECKASLSRAALLAHPVPTAPLALVRDASTTTMGAVLQSIC